MGVEKLSWVRLVLQWRGSIAPKVFPGVLLCGGFGFLISLLDYLGFPVSWVGFDIVITNVSYNLVLGLLLVFRTNTAYDRFWEGRKAWGTITASIRSLGHLIWVSITEIEPQDRENKVSTLRLILEFRLRCQEATSWEEVITVKTGISSRVLIANKTPLYKIDVK
jgi:putative membrane protein